MRLNINKLKVPDALIVAQIEEKETYHWNQINCSVWANAAVDRAPDLDHHMHSLEDIAAFQEARSRWQPGKQWDEAPSPDQPAA